MNLSKLEFFALLVVIFVGLHFYNKHKMENERFDEPLTEAPLYLQGDRPPVILAFGDSLTAGPGVPKDATYPAQLSEMLGTEVINAGVAGESTGNALYRLPRVLARYNPDIVILEEGADDIIAGRKRELIRNNLQKMIDLIKKRGAKVVLVGVPDPDLIDLMIGSDVSLYEELAKEMKVYYIPDVYGEILKSEELKLEPFRPNEKGYRIVAEKISDFLRELFI
ncbi:GDSL-type esterase/lipase family protein [Hydrogenimonas sp.]